MSQELHIGIMSVQSAIFNQMNPPITFQDCTTQRELQAFGVFQRIHDFLLLPETYTIKALFYDAYDKREWSLYLESPEIPTVDEDAPFPVVEPVYCLTQTPEEEPMPGLEKIPLKSGEPFKFGGIPLVKQAHLVEIKITTRDVKPVVGGLDFLLEAIAGDSAKRREP